MNSILRVLGNDPVKMNLLLVLIMPFVLALVVAAICECASVLSHKWTRHHRHHRPHAH